MIELRLTPYLKWKYEKHLEEEETRRWLIQYEKDELKRDEAAQQYIPILEEIMENGMTRQDALWELVKSDRDNLLGASRDEQYEYLKNVTHACFLIGWNNDR